MYCAKYSRKKSYRPPLIIVNYFIIEWLKTEEHFKEALFANQSVNDTDIVHFLQKYVRV